MSRYRGPRLKIIRRLGTPLPGLMRTDPELRRPYPPGQHGPTRRRKLSDYALRLVEKQKLRYHYNVLEKQFRRYIAKASRLRGNTGEVLLQLLERRLDNVLRRAGFVRTIWAARQMVVHGHVLVNGKKVDRPSFAVSTGDIITLQPKVQDLARTNMETLAGHIVSDWLTMNPSELTCTVVSQPTPDQIPFDVNTNLIVEFYR